MRPTLREHRAVCRHCRKGTPLPECPKPRPRGFATMTPELVKEYARRGGAKAQAMGVAHRFTSEEARAAGAIGGSAPKKRRKPPTKVEVQEWSDELLELGESLKKEPAQK